MKEFWGASDIETGSYTPTATNGANCDNIVPSVAHFSISGDIATVFGEVLINATTLDTETLFNLSLPDGATLSTTYSLSGNGGRNEEGTIVNENITIYGDTVNNNARFRLSAGSTAGRNYSYAYHYVAG